MPSWTPSRISPSTCSAPWPLYERWTGTRSTCSPNSQRRSTRSRRSIPPTDSLPFKQPKSSLQTLPWFSRRSLRLPGQSRTSFTLAQQSSMRISRTIARASTVPGRRSARSSSGLPILRRIVTPSDVGLRRMSRAPWVGLLLLSLAAVGAESQLVRLPFVSALYCGLHVRYSAAASSSSLVQQQPSSRSNKTFDNNNNSLISIIAN